MYQKSRMICFLYIWETLRQEIVWQILIIATGELFGQVKLKEETFLVTLTMRVRAKVHGLLLYKGFEGIDRLD